MGFTNYLFRSAKGHGIPSDSVNKDGYSSTLSVALRVIFKVSCFLEKRMPEMNGSGILFERYFAPSPKKNCR